MRFNIIFIAWNHSLTQNPIIQKILSEIQLDSLTNFVRQLNGEKAVIINEEAVTIESRHTNHPGNELTFQSMKSEFIRWGYRIVRLKERCIYLAAVHYFHFNST